MWARAGSDVNVPEMASSTVVGCVASVVTAAGPSGSEYRNETSTPNIGRTCRKTEAMQAHVRDRPTQLGASSLKTRRLSDI